MRGRGLHREDLQEGVRGEIAASKGGEERKDS